MVSRAVSRLLSFRLVSLTLQCFTSLTRSSSVGSSWTCCAQYACTFCSPPPAMALSPSAFPAPNSRATRI
eukprot:7835205-Pyramimonas_sp.AAC.1